MPIIDVLMKPIWLFPKKLRDHALGKKLERLEWSFFSPFAQSISHFLNFKLPVEGST
jgi:hypothetical protein